MTELTRGIEEFPRAAEASGLRGITTCGPEKGFWGCGSDVSRWSCLCGNNRKHHNNWRQFVCFCSCVKTSDYLMQERHGVLSWWRMDFVRQKNSHVNLRDDFSVSSHKSKVSACIVLLSTMVEIRYTYVLILGFFSSRERHFPCPLCFPRTRSHLLIRSVSPPSLWSSRSGGTFWVSIRGNKNLMREGRPSEQSEMALSDWAESSAGPPP